MFVVQIKGETNRSKGRRVETWQPVYDDGGRVYGFDTMYDAESAAQQLAGDAKNSETFRVEEVIVL